MRRRKKSPKFYRTGLADFMLSYKTTKRGGTWKPLAPAAKSFQVPGKAVAVRVRLRTHASPLDVAEFTREKSKTGPSYGLKRLLRMLNKPPKRAGSPKYQTVLEFLNERLGQWRLSVGLVPSSRYYKDGAFFTAESELKRTWDRIAIWYAIESDGMSDGSPVAEDEKAYHIGVTYFEVKDARLGTKLLERFRELVEERLFHEAEDENDRNGIAVMHNENPDYKQWASEAILLATEGIPDKKHTGDKREVQGKVGARRATKRVRARK